MTERERECEEKGERTAVWGILPQASGSVAEGKLLNSFSVCDGVVVDLLLLCLSPLSISPALRFFSFYVYLILPAAL